MSGTLQEGEEVDLCFFVGLNIVLRFVSKLSENILVSIPSHSGVLTSHTTVRTHGATSKPPKLPPEAKRGLRKGVFTRLSTLHESILNSNFPGTPLAPAVMSARATLKTRLRTIWRRESA